MRDGACSRAIAGLTTEVASLAPADQRAWAATLLPDSQRGRRALSNPAAASAEAEGDEQERRGPMQGVRFAALSAPGPSGMRPEHLQEALGVRRRHVCGPLNSALRCLHRAAAAGALPAASRWILESKLCFLKKKSGPAPRPIRVGEVLRRVVAKRFAFDERGAAGKLFMQHRQFGAGIPGGLDAAVAFRLTAERVLLRRGRRTAVVDIDLCNAFPSLEWDDIRESCARHFPGLLAWLEWCHAAPSRVQLPSGECIEVSRGVEQGDPLGGLLTSAVILDAVQGARADLAAQGVEFFDVWYLDDGQLFCDERDVDVILRALDARFAAVGATRGSGPRVKSVARVLGSGDVPHPRAWMTPYVADTCAMPADDAVHLTHVLGVEADARDEAPAAMTEQFRRACQKVAAVHERFPDLEDAPAEFTLLRSCAGVCKVTHLLRSVGPDIRAEALAEFDDVIMAALGRALASEVPPLPRLQAGLPTSQAGLGLASAVELAAAAFVAARTEARPMACYLLEGLAGVVGDSSAFLEEYDGALEDARRLLLSQAGDARRARIDALIAQAEGDATARFSAARSGHVVPATTLAAEAEASLVQPAGAEDPETRDGSRLQGALSLVLGEARLEALDEALRAAGDWPGLRRVAQLRHPSTDHSWIRCLHAAHGPVLSAAEYVDSLALRLGMPLVPENTECSLCGEVMDRCGVHPQTCAQGAATRGHYRVCHRVHLLAALGDPEAAPEPLGLIPSRPLLRPADIFTSAAHGSLAALDVGVCSPEAAGAGLDCCAAMVRRKQQAYAPFFGELRQRGVRYQPMVWSSYGRAHVEAEDTLQGLARAAARRRGIPDWRPLLRRSRAAISVELQRRLGGQLRRCLPEEPPESAGASDASPAPRTRVAEDEEEAALGDAAAAPPADGVLAAAAAAAGLDGLAGLASAAGEASGAAGAATGAGDADLLTALAELDGAADGAGGDAALPAGAHPAGGAAPGGAAGGAAPGGAADPDGAGGAALAPGAAAAEAGLEAEPAAGAGAASPDDARPEVAVAAGDRGARVRALRLVYGRGP